MIRAFGKSAHGAPLTPYTLTASVQAGPPDLEFEPNDDAQHATPIHDTASGYLAPAGDQDWYLVHANGGAILHAEVADAGQLTVVGADGGVLAQGELVVPAVGLDDGDAFVVVKAGQTPADPDALYKLSVQLSPDDGSIEREPNDTIATAQRVTLPAEVKGFIWPRKDVDVFRFQVPAGHAPISIRLSAVPGVDLALRLYEMHGESGEVIGSSDSTRGEGEERAHCDVEHSQPASATEDALNRGSERQPYEAARQRRQAEEPSEESGLHDGASCLCAEKRACGADTHEPRFRVDPLKNRGR